MPGRALQTAPLQGVCCSPHHQSGLWARGRDTAQGSACPRVRSGSWLWVWRRLCLWLGLPPGICTAGLPFSHPIPFPRGWGVLHADFSPLPTQHFSHQYDPRVSERLCAPPRALVLRPLLCCSKRPALAAGCSSVAPVALNS